MGSATHYLEIQAPARQCYDWWRPLTHLPQVFPDLERVEPHDGDADLTHWVASGPAGARIEWDARIVDEEPGHKVAWKSVENNTERANTVANAGAVRFDDHGDSTGVEVSLHYDPPGGTVGEAVATLFADPQTKVEQALGSFKDLMEASSRS